MEKQVGEIQEAEVIDTNSKDYNQIMQFNQALQQLSQAKHPFNIALAKDVKVVEDILKVYNEKREAIIDKYAVRDENGEFVGALIDDPAGAKEEDGVTTVKIRVANPQKINEIEWTDKNAVIDEINALGTEKVALNLAPIDVNKTYLDTKLNKELTIYSYLDANFEAGLILYLNAFGMFTGLDI